MKQFRLGEWVNYRPLECGGQVISKNPDKSITLKLSQPNMGNLDIVEISPPFILVEHLSERYHC